MLRISKWAAPLAVIGAIALAGSPASGTTTGELLRKCQANSKSEAYRTCVTYLSGIRDAYLFERSLKNGRIKLLCAPADLSVSQVKQAYLRYMQRHRDYLNYEAASYVYISLIDAYPCRRK
jgi:hypothetical protein